MLEKAKKYGCDLHKSVNHKYGNQEYSFHLHMVFGIAQGFIDLIPEHYREDVLASCFLHDTIEDCRVTYNDIKSEFNTDIAEIVYALTNDKGKNRKERAGEKYYKGIRETPYADFVKLCDRIANVQFSRLSESSMLNKYRKENKEFTQSIYNEKYHSMFQYLEDNLK